jgi:leucyl-tRNA synthetase
VKIRHRTIQAVTERTEVFKFNTAVSALMEFLNALSSGASREDLEVLTLLLSPYAPHLAEEIWEKSGREGGIQGWKWPVADPVHLKEDTVELPVQINGKLRDRVSVPADATAAAILSAAKGSPKTAEALKGALVLKEIVVPGKMVSFVLGSKSVEVAK